MSEEDRRIIYDPSRSANRRLADYGTDERAWFADEVAIDFPSVDGILGRMRKAFFRPGTRDVAAVHGSAADGD